MKGDIFKFRLATFLKISWFYTTREQTQRRSLYFHAYDARRNIGLQFQEVFFGGGGE